MSKHGFTRRNLLKGGAAAASAVQVRPAAAGRPAYTYRTQFDAQLLAESYDPMLVANHGRHVLVMPDGTVRTVLAWGGENPRVHVYRNRELAEEYPLRGWPSVPTLTSDGVWYSVGNTVFRGRQAQPGIEGTISDAAVAPNGSTALALNTNSRLQLALLAGDQPKTISVDDGAANPSIEFDPSGALHVAYERRMGIEYRVYENGKLRLSERAAEAFSFHPVLLAARGRILLAYLGESYRLPSAMHGSDAWEQLGRGGYVAVLIRQSGGWKRHRLAASRPLSKALYPIDTDSRGYAPEFAYHWSEIGSYSAGLTRRLISDMEEYSAPALCIGADGVVQVVWANKQRRWVYGARLLGDELAPLNEIRGPIEQLTGPCLMPKQARSAEEMPLATVSRSRVYLDAIALPSRTVTNGKQIDFITPDELSECRGLEFCVNQMRRSPQNPVQRSPRRDTSAGPRPNIPFIEDPSEKNTAHRFKGLVRDPAYQGFDWLPVTSADGIKWNRVPNPRTLVRCDVPMRIWIDPDDIPERRYKANGISRSFCGRISVQYTSPNGIDWNDERDTLDFEEPFRSRPDPNPTGRILLDSWSGPEDEAELHGGFIFRDGERWLLHYMKWSPDGHIYCALAASRDGLNFSRVGGGVPTLPLGEPGTWDAGRVALSEPPSAHNHLWVQQYTGCGWKHGMAGAGNRTSHMAGAYSPMQTGIAEIEKGHWVHLQTKRDAENGELTTIPLRLTCAHSVRIDAEGGVVKAAIFDRAKGQEIPGFGYAEFDALDPDGRGTWKGKGLETLGAHTDVQFRIRLSGARVKLYSIRLVRQAGEQ